jgi:predicted  nucleic acid-binding Zn-ribbon protein
MTNRFHTESLMKSVSNFPVSKGGSGSGRYPKGSGSSEMPDISGIESALDKADELSETVGGTLENYVESSVDDTERSIENMESAVSDFAEANEDDYDTEEERDNVVRDAQDNWDSSVGEAYSTSGDVQSYFEQLSEDGTRDMGQVIDDIVDQFRSAGLFYDEVEGGLLAIEQARSAVENFEGATANGSSYAKGFNEIVGDYTPETIDGWENVGDFDSVREYLDDAQSALEDFNNAISDVRFAVEGIGAQVTEANRTAFFAGRDAEIREAVASDDHSTASATHRELASEHNAYEGDAEISASQAHKQAAELHEAADAIRQSSGKGNAGYKVLADQAEQASNKALEASNQTF